MQQLECRETVEVFGEPAHPLSLQRRVVVSPYTADRLPLGQEKNGRENSSSSSAGLGHASFVHRLLFLELVTTSMVNMTVDVCD